jgi:hypothetical protein
MPVVRIEGLSKRDAEDLITKIWLILEGEGIATPKVRLTRGKSVTLMLYFASSEDAALVSHALGDAAAESGFAAD